MCAHLITKMYFKVKSQVTEIHSGKLAFITLIIKEIERKEKTVWLHKEALP